MRLKVFIFLLLLILSISSGWAWGQDTPAPIRDVAINDLNTQIANIGRPDGWQHTLENSSDRNLNCPLLPAGGALANPVEVYVLTLFYGNSAYVYRVSADATIVVACDQQLFDASAGLPQTPVSSVCPDDVRAKSRLLPREIVNVALSMPTYQLAATTSNILATISPQAQLTLLDGPHCNERAIWWFVDYGNGRGYMMEYDLVHDIYYLIRSVNTPTGNSGTNLGVYQSVTCPADFAGYLPPRLFVGATGRVESGGSNNIMRQSYGRSNQPTGTEIPPGGTFTVVGGPECTGANLGEAILWWQVSYNGVTGWTAESLNGEYFLELDGATAPVAPHQVETTVDPDTLPTIEIPMNIAPSITAANVASLRQIATLGMPDSIVSLEVSQTGIMGIYLRGMSLHNNAIFYQSINGTAAMVTLDVPLGVNDQYIALNPFGSVYAMTLGNPDGSSDLVVKNFQPGTENLRLNVGDISAYSGAFSEENLFLLGYTVNADTPSPKLTAFNITSQITTDLAITDNIVDLEFSQDDSFFVGIETSGKVNIWDGASLQLYGSFDTMPNASHIAISPDGTRLAVSGSGKTVQVWNIATADVVMERELTVSYDPVAVYEVSALAFSADGSLLAAGGYELPMVNNGDNPVLLFDVASGNQVATLVGLEKVMSISFTEQGRLLIANGEYHAIIWAVPTP